MACAVRERPRAVRLLAPLCWTALIAWFSSDAWSATVTRSAALPWVAALLPWMTPDTFEALHGLIRKAAHVTEYGLLAFLWAWALAGWRRALVLSVLTAFLDEAHQATTADREGSAADFALDSSSAAAMLWLVHRGLGQALDTLAWVLLWIAAAGGTALLALNVTTGAPSGGLWLSVPAAWLALAVFGTMTRRP